MKWTPDKVTTLILIVGCLVLLFTGRDGEVKSILTVAAGWLFGTGYMDIKRGGK
ncbi:unnamed protein product [marine sediment metagenome]|uniref:Uncharacterized protein n=1 Tax=marine sediment metagenome TaxID=412755 RepID=X1S6R1_9ZZZZ